MRLSTPVIWAMVIVGAVAMYRGAKGAEHPAATSEKPPGWRVHRALPGQDYQPRGRFFDNRTGCQVDLASDAIGSPAGSRFVCLRIDANNKVTTR